MFEICFQFEEPYNVLIALVESISFEFLLFSLKSLELLSNIRINEVGNILAIHDLRHDVNLPFWVRKQVVFYTLKSAKVSI
jgi:hypothetical protein